MTSTLRRSRIPWPTVVGALVLVTVVAHTGTAPVVAGLGSVDAPTLAACVALAAVSTVACAWRWRLVATGLGVAIGMQAAVAACYRAQLLNTVLPGGVLGDVHRGLVHGRSTGETGRALRAVGWERFAGQVVQALLALVVLLLLPSPVRAALPWALAVVVVAVIGVVLLVRHAPERPTRWSRVARVVRDDITLALLVRRSWPGIVVASVVAVAGHVTTYVVAARAVGVSAPVTTLVPLAVVVLVVAAVPLNLAGWGPREGMAAWVFAGAGLGAGTGVATAVAYGAIVLVANLPGVVVLLRARGPERARVIHVEAGGRARA